MATALEEKYELKLMPFAIGGKRLSLYGVANWDPFVEKLAREGKDYVKDFPFWVKVWEASIVLSDYLLGIGLDGEKNILEIGAGMGVTGLFLGLLGHRVTITDYEEDALALLRMNVEHNELSNVTVKRLDWNNPDLAGRYDIICGSELIYNEGFIEPIINLFRRYLSPDGTVFLAHDLKRKCLMQFIGMVPGKFEIENIMRTMRGNDEIHRIAIHLLHVKR